MPNDTERELLALLHESPQPDAPSENEAAMLESLWGSPPVTGRQVTMADIGTLDEGIPEFDIEQLFMTPDAVAQATSSGYDIQFDAGFLEEDLPAPTRQGRFRIDQPPPPVAFNRSQQSPDGVVVSRRSGGHFEPVRMASTRNVAPGEVMRGRPPPSPSPAPAPRPAPSQPEPVVDRASLPTKYDVLRKGGLDL